MAFRIVCAVLCFTSAILLLLFSSLMTRRSVTMAMICAKHNWSPEEKGRAMAMAAYMYIGGGLIALAGEAVLGWFAKTPAGAACSRTWTKYSFKLYRMLFAKVEDKGYKSSDNSEDSDDELRELRPSSRAKAGVNVVAPNSKLVSGHHSRTGSSSNVVTAHQISSALPPSAAAASTGLPATVTTNNNPFRS